MDPTTTAHSSALHHSQISASTDDQGRPILTTSLATPSLDFNPNEFKPTPAAGTGGDLSLGAQLNSGFDSASSSHGATAGGEGAHANPHPVVAKSGVDLSEGVARPAETQPAGSANAQVQAQAQAQDTANTVSASAANAALTARDSAQDTANKVASSASRTADQVSASASNAAQTVKDNAPTVTGIRKRAGSISETVGAKVNSVSSTVSAQVQQAADHPAVQNVKKDAQRQVGQFREVLGRYPIVLEAEKRTGVDRVALVVGGVFLYLLLIPLNLFGLALPTTQLLTFLPPTLLALRVLDKPNEDRTKVLLSYFVVFGFVQFTESLMAGFLERRIPQYYTVKLLFLAYLIHPRTKGALKIHAQVFRPLLARAQHAQKPSAYTPPTSKPATGSAYGSPTFSASSNPSGTASDAPLSRTAGFSGTGPSSAGHSGAPEPASGYGRVAPVDGYPIGQVGQGQVHLPSGGGIGVGQEVPKY